MSYRIVFAAGVAGHLRSLTATQRAFILDAIERQLQHEPTSETKNRKPLRTNPLAPWELRAGALRVFYDVVSEEDGVVRILAIGRKRGNALWIGGQEIVL